MDIKEEKRNKVGIHKALQKTADGHLNEMKNSSIIEDGSVSDKHRANALNNTDKYGMGTSQELVPDQDSPSKNDSISSRNYQQGEMDVMYENSGVLTPADMLKETRADNFVEKKRIV